MFIIFGIFSMVYVFIRKSMLINFGQIVFEKIYETNKQFFTEDFKKISYVELTPNILTGQSEYSELYFKKMRVDN